MAPTQQQTPEVILVIEAVDLVSDLQQQFVPRGFTVRFAEDPASAREICETVRPRLVVAPVDGASGELLAAWSQSWAPADVVIGLVEQLSDASEAPGCVQRTARKGQPKELVSLADLLLRSHPAGKAADSAAEGTSEPIRDKPGGILANAQATKEAGDEADEPDLDPSRVSDIRSLGVAMRMAKTMGQESSATDSSGSIRLRHGEGAKDDVSLTPAEGLRVADALSELPEARAAMTETGRMKVLAESAPVATSEQPSKPKDPTKPDLPLESAVAPGKLRRGLVIGLAIVLVLGGGATAYWLLRGRSKPGKTSRVSSVTADKVAPGPMLRKPKHGTHVDVFAGTIARFPKVVTALDVDVRDEHLHLSVPELNPFLEKTLRRLPRRKRRALLLERGAKLLGFERYPEARRYLKRAVELRDSPKARALLARAYAGLGRYWAAVIHQKHAIKRDKGNAELRFRLGQYYLRADKQKKACRAFKAAAKRDDKYKKQLKKHCGRSRR